MSSVIIHLTLNSCGLTSSHEKQEEKWQHWQVDQEIKAKSISENWETSSQDPKMELKPKQKKDTARESGVSGYLSPLLQGDQVKGR